MAVISDTSYNQLNKNIENLEEHLKQNVTPIKGSRINCNADKILVKIDEVSCLIKLFQFNDYDLNGTIRILGEYLIHNF